MRFLIPVILVLFACSTPPRWPAPLEWALVGDIPLSNGKRLALGQRPVLPADSTYLQDIICIGPCLGQTPPRVLVYAPSDTAFLTRVEARTEGDTLVSDIGFRYGPRITLDSVILRYTLILGKPSEVVRDPNSERQSAQWTKKGFMLTISGPSWVHSRPLTGYLTRYNGSSHRPIPDAEWRLRGCTEFSYLFCPVSRSFLY